MQPIESILADAASIAALRRDIHFLSRHPTCLFQCLWNIGWWYDCPQAAIYYGLSGRTGSVPLPWEGPDAKLSGWLEAWREAREGSGTADRIGQTAAPRPGP